MFLAYLGALLGPDAALAGSATAPQNSLSGLHRVLDLLAEPVEMPAAPNAVQVKRETVEGRITFRDVSFAYSGSAASVHLEERARSNYPPWPPPSALSYSSTTHRCEPAHPIVPDD